MHWTELVPGMGMPIKKKTYELKSRLGDGLEVRIEKVDTGEKADILYRITRGKHRRVAAPEGVVLFKEELEELAGFLEEEFLSREFPEQ
ncbi:MAG: hypothetical protein JSW53_02620 [Candidatus Bathyarchaeota archaeon]|nr:MAG: hypothetical protein JSW53_02620 [Candidatus Bathyarchaeota archaeon]